MLQPELKDAMHVKFDFNQPMDIDQNQVPSHNEVDL